MQKELMRLIKIQFDGARAFYISVVYIYSYMLIIEATLDGSTLKRAYTNKQKRKREDES